MKRTYYMVTTESGDPLMDASQQLYIYPRKWKARNIADHGEKVVKVQLTPIADKKRKRKK